MTLPTKPPPTPSTGDTWRDLIADLGPEYPGRRETARSGVAR